MNMQIIHGMMWIWWVVGIPLIVLLIVLIVKLLKKGAHYLSYLSMHPGVERCWQFDNSRRPGRCIALMSFLRIPAIIRVVAFFAVLVFAGDIITYSSADPRAGHCVSQTSQSDSSHEKTPCSHCWCAVHSGAVVMADFTVRVGSSLNSATGLPATDQPAPSRLAASIDHPPQLA